MDRTVPSPKLLVAGGAVVLASAAYALGTQAAGGTADASDERVARSAPAGAPGPTDRTHGARRHSRELDAAATALGVRPEQLRSALRELRPERPEVADRRQEFAAALAKGLGVDLAKVTAALAAQSPAGRPIRPDRGAFFAALGTELGVSAEKVEAAIRKVRPERGGRHDRGAFMAALAGELGVTEARLRSAFGAVGPGRDGRRGPRFDTAAFAQALGVSEDAITRVLRTLREQRGARHDTERAAFTRALAAKLGVSEAKVVAVLGEHGPARFDGPGRRRGADHGVGPRHAAGHGPRRGFPPRP